MDCVLAQGEQEAVPAQSPVERDLEAGWQQENAPAEETGGPPGSAFVRRGAAWLPQES